MEISRTAKKTDADATLVCTSKQCLGCRDCKGPCLLFIQLYAAEQAVASSRSALA